MAEMAAAPALTDADPRPTVAIFRAPLFNPSETFVRAHAAGLTRYRPLFVGLEDRGNGGPELRTRPLVPANARAALALKLFGRGGDLLERLRDAAPTLIHAHFATDGLIALPLARELGVPLVTTLHGHDVARPRARMLLSGRLSWMKYAATGRRLADGGALFLAVSDAVRAKALALGFPDDRTVTHRLGVDLARFRPDPERAEPGLVLHVGRLVEKKGTETLLDAFARIVNRQPGARLVVIGDGPEKPALVRRAAALGLSGIVRFLGMLPHDEVAAWLRRAWLLAAPSVTARNGDAEGLPTVLVEAAASGIPAVGTHHSGIAEAIVDGDNGWLVRERDPEALAARIAELLASPGQRDRMAGAARALAVARFDAACRTRILEDHYDSLGHEGSPRRSR